MSINDYDKLKKQMNRLEYLIRNCKDQTELNQLKKELEQTKEELKTAEQIEPISHYADLLKRKTSTLKLIGSWKYYKKDTTKLEETLTKLETEISDVKNGPKVAPEPIHLYPHTSVATDRKEENESLMLYIKQLIEKVDNNSSNSAGLVKQSTEPTYYIINLAWSKETGDIVNTVRDFLNMSNHIQFYQEKDTGRCETIMTWKFSYDTPEEQATSKSLRMCASHLLDVLKMRYPRQTDAEIFGKIQKY